MIRRINLYGVPCSGKSRCASFIFSELVEQKIELVHEHIKPNAYRGIDTLPFGQIGWLHKQIETEETYLRHGADLIVTDCPLYLSSFYAQEYKRKCGDIIAKIATEFEKDYPSMNLYMRPLPYIKEGRFQTEEDISRLDIHLRDHLDSWGVRYTVFDARNRLEILKHVRLQLKQS